MAKISPGPVPNDNTRIVPSRDLQALVSGTRVFDFGNEEFEGAALAFVVSATDAPATSVRTRATIWFERGKGRLHHWFVWTPTEGPHSGQTQGHWVDGSDRRTLIAEYRYPILVGSPLLLDSTATENHTRLCSFGFHLPKVAGSTFSSLTSISLTSDAGASLWHYWQERPRDPCFVALDQSSSYSGAVYGEVGELGFFDAFVQTDYSGPGNKIMLEALVARASFFKLASTATAPIAEAVIGITTDSRQSFSSQRRVGIFKYGAFTHRPF